LQKKKRIDVNVSTRLASTGYTAPDNESIADIKAKTDNLPNDPASQSAIKGSGNRDLTEVYNNTPSIDPTSVWNHPSRTLTAGTKDSEIDSIKLKTDKLIFNDNDQVASDPKTIAPLVAQQIRDAMKLSPSEGVPETGSIDNLISEIPLNPLLDDDIRLGNLDATISSRLASIDYTAPDNESIADIKAKTDNLPNDPAQQSSIESKIDSQTIELKGIDNRDLTEVYDRINFTEVLNAIISLNDISVADIEASIVLAKENTLQSVANAIALIPTTDSVADLTPVLNAISNLNDVTPAEVRAAFDAADFKDKNTESEIHAWLDTYTNKDNWKVDLGDIPTDVAAIKSKTDNLPVNPASVDDIPTASENANATWEYER